MKSDKFLEKDYGSLDKFVSIEILNDIANMFNDGKYKIIQVRRTFAYDYLKRVGINTRKKSFWKTRYVFYYIYCSY